MYNLVMTQVSLSDFRTNLPTYMNRVFAGEEFLVVKNKIPMGTMSPVRKEKIVKRQILPGATKLMSHLKGSTVEIADRLREKALYGNYGSR